MRTSQRRDIREFAAVEPLASVICTLKEANGLPSVTTGATAVLAVRACVGAAC
jgi:hypothetical protein